MKLCACEGKLYCQSAIIPTWVGDGPDGSVVVLDVMIFEEIVVLEVVVGFADDIGTGGAAPVHSTQYSVPTSNVGQTTPGL